MTKSSLTVRSCPYGVENIAATGISNNAEIVPGGFTNWHCHNGAAFFVALQGQFEAHFQEGVLVKAKAGECYSEPIAKFHRGHNPHPDLPYLCIGLCFTSPDREHVTNSVERPW